MPRKHQFAGASEAAASAGIVRTRWLWKLVAPCWAEVVPNLAANAGRALRPMLPPSAHERRPFFVHRDSVSRSSARSATVHRNRAGDGGLVALATARARQTHRQLQWVRKGAQSTGPKRKHGSQLIFFACFWCFEATCLPACRCRGALGTTPRARAHEMYAGLCSMPAQTKQTYDDTSSACNPHSFCPAAAVVETSRRAVR